MEEYHEDRSLAPRDVVARAIDNELKKTGRDSVFLDVTHLDAAFVRERFPNIFERCHSLGIDITRQPIPVVPAAHYLCGGVRTDEHARTNIPGLFAVGETSCTGLHGACRMASNSLLEGLVFAARAAESVREAELVRPARVEAWQSGDATDSDDAIVVSLNWDEIRRFMWSYLGIVRSDKRIERAKHRIELLAHLIIESASRRKESRGLHYTLDYPDKDERFGVDTVVMQSDGTVPV
jgi:L-aspartate oxidase